MLQNNGNNLFDKAILARMKISGYTCYAALPTAQAAYLRSCAGKIGGYCLLPCMAEPAPTVGVAFALYPAKSA
jgi:hypothetical protein